jgi:hypothetical protein
VAQQRFSAGWADYLTAIERLGTECLVCLTPDRLFIHLTEHFSDGEQAFIDIPVVRAPPETALCGRPTSSSARVQETMFRDYVFEKKDGREIPFRVSASTVPLVAPLTHTRARTRCW